MFEVGCIVNYGDGIGTVTSVSDANLTLAMHDGTTDVVSKLSCTLLMDRKGVIKVFEEGVLGCDKWKHSDSK